MTIKELFGDCLDMVLLLATDDDEKYEQAAKLLNERNIPEDVQICLMKNAIALAKVYGE